MAAILLMVGCDDSDDTVLNTDGGADASVIPDGGGNKDSSPGVDTGNVEAGPVNPNAHMVGDATKGKDVFRFATFGSEGFWTDGAKLVKGITEYPNGTATPGLTPVQALKAGLHVDSEAVAKAVDTATLMKVIAELKTDLSPANAPILNDPKTTITLLNANSVIGVSVIDTNKDGKFDVASGDKVGVTCAACHGITDGSVFPANPAMVGLGTIGKRLDGPATHSINIGAIFAMAANTKAFFPMAQLKGADGKTIGKSATGLTKDSTEAEFDAYFSNPANYPVGSFDDTVDGNGNPMHNTPLFRTDLAAPWGSAGEFSKLDQFANTVYTVLLDPTNLLSPGGRAFIAKLAGAAGTAMLADYEVVLTATGVTGYPFVQGDAHAADLDAVTGIRVNNQQLLDMNAYLNSLRSPKGATVDAAVATRAKGVFASQCTQCHNADQTVFLKPDVLPLKTVWPGDDPVVLAPRVAPLGPVSNTVAGTFDDKMIVVNATQRGLIRGSALPLLMDLARKPVFLHDSTVPTLDNLFDPARTATAPHPFYIPDTASRADMVLYLKSLDDTSK